MILTLGPMFILSDTSILGKRAFARDSCPNLGAEEENDNQDAHRNYGENPPYPSIFGD